MDISQLLSPTEAASRKGLSLNAFKYKLRQEGAPKPVLIGNDHPFYAIADLDAWKPAGRPQKRKSTRKGVTAGNPGTTTNH